MNVKASSPKGFFSGDYYGDKITKEENMDAPSM